MQSSTSDLPPDEVQVEAGREERKGASEEEAYEEGREVGEQEPFEEEDRMDEAEGEEDDEEDEGKLEWPAGVAQASERDLAKLSDEEGVRTVSNCSSKTNQLRLLRPSQSPASLLANRLFTFISHLFLCQPFPP